VKAVDVAVDIPPGAVEAFQRNGYYHAKALLDPAEIARHREAVDLAVAIRTRNDTRKLEERSLFEQSFTMCRKDHQHPSLVSPELQGRPAVHASA